MDDMDDDEDDNIMDNECQIHLKDDDMNVMDADLGNDPFISINNANNNIIINTNTNSNNVNHYMNISSTINANTSVNDYYQNVMQLQNGESV